MVSAAIASHVAFKCHEHIRRSTVASVNSRERRLSLVKSLAKPCPNRVRGANMSAASVVNRPDVDEQDTSEAAPSVNGDGRKPNAEISRDRETMAERATEVVDLPAASAGVLQPVKSLLLSRGELPTIP